MKNPYEILGVQRTDTEAAIRSAYRKLAKRHHPDVNPGKPEALERFKEISTAYDLLSDKDKRARFDRGEIDADGHDIQPERPFYRDFQQGAGRGGAGRGSAGGQAGQERYQAAGGFTQEDIEAFFSQAFNQTSGRNGADFAARGRDVTYGLTVSFVDAANGTTRRLSLPDGRVLDVRIPPGTEDGHMLRLRGQGGPGLHGGQPGDAIIEITVAPDAHFRREGDDIITELPVTLREAVLGLSLEVQTIRGPVRLTIPPGSGTGTRLRLRGRGIREGHQFVELKVVLPPGDEPDLAAFLKTWTPRTPFNPREAL